MYQAQLRLAVKAARRAAALHRRFLKSGFEVVEKGSPQNRTTTADMEAEKLIASMIRRRWPRHNVLGEEAGLSGKGSPWLWIVDPLDGTNNYERGIPHYAVSIALAHEGRLACACVLDCATGECFTAERGRGARLNGKPIHCSDRGALSGTMLGTGFYYDRGAPIKETLKAIDGFFDMGITCVRRIGAAALDLCYVAAGRYDGFWEYKLSPWDFAAGVLILEEAGGRASGAQGEELPLREQAFVVASNGLIHDDMLRVIGLSRHKKA
jgi:myo-inositol-1(or 4)-monophosphatase